MTMRHQGGNYFKSRKTGERLMFTYNIAIFNCVESNFAFSLVLHCYALCLAKKSGITY